MQVLGPLVEVADSFQEQYKALATALDSTRHELPGRAIHLEQDGLHLLGESRHPRPGGPCWAQAQPDLLGAEPAC